MEIRRWHRSGSVTNGFDEWNDGVAKAMAKGSGNFNDPAWQKANAQESIEKVIAGGRGRMPKYAGKVTPEVIKAIAAHIKTLVTAK